MRLHAQLVGESLVFAEVGFFSDHLPRPLSKVRRHGEVSLSGDAVLDRWCLRFPGYRRRSSGVDCDVALTASFKHGTDVRLYRVKSVQQGSQRSWGSWGSSVEAIWRGSGTALWEEES